jgi:8-oxo-dGTP diphosphatase
MWQGKAPNVGVGVLIWRDHQLLLIKRRSEHGQGTWSTPGGYLEFGETPEECAKREALEETGIEISDVKFKAITNDFFKESDKHFITIWMEGKFAGGELTINEEVEELGWFEQNELPKLLFLSFKNLVEGKCYHS